jgi:puromycin-sensitive aminopeptidase
MFSTSKKPDEVVHYTVLQTHSSEVMLKDVAAHEWVKVNPGTVGFYRTQYPPDMLAQFVAAIHEKSLPPLDRLGLLDDLFAMVTAWFINLMEELIMKT